MLARLRHPNIILFLGASIQTKSSGRSDDVSGESDGGFTGMLLVSELMEAGTLFDLLYRREERITWGQYRSLLEQIALGLNYLHLQTPNPVIHRDIKPTNCLLDRHGGLKLADFGLSCFRPADADVLTAQCGTPNYMAPELLVHAPYTEKVDVYAFGMVAHEILVRSPPFLDVPLMRLKVLVGQQAHRPRFPDGASPGVRKLIEVTWAQEAARRPTAAQTLAFVQTRL